MTSTAIDGGLQFRLADGAEPMRPWGDIVSRWRNPYRLNAAKTQRSTAQLRRVVFINTLKTIGFLAIAFFILRIVGPWLVDLHDTTALVAAIVLVVGLLIIFAWFAWGVAVAVLGRRHDDY